MDRYAAPACHPAAFSPTLAGLGPRAAGVLALLIGLGFLVGTAGALVHMVETPASAIGLAGAVAAATFLLALLGFGAGFARLAQPEQRS